MIFHFFNNLAGLNIFVDEVIAFAAIYTPLIIAVLITYLFWYGSINYKKSEILKSLLIPAAILTLIYLIELYLVTHIFHHDFRSRPFSHYWATLLISQAGIPSFPAWPVVFTAIFLPLIYNYNKKLGHISSIITFIGGLSLVIAGVHYLSDILIGWIIGILAGVFGIQYFLKIAVKKYFIAVGILLVLSLFVMTSELSEMRIEKTAITNEKHITDERKINNSELLQLSKSVGVEEIDGEYATNGRMVAVDIRIYDKSWTVNKIKKSTIAIIDNLFINHKDFSVITVEIYEGSGKKTIWLYTATVYRFDWIQGKNPPGLKGYGNKYYKLEAD